jgi:hypothetical protein
MGQLRDRMEADLFLAGLSASTRAHYIYCARRFVKYWWRSPDQLGEQEVRDFLLHLTKIKGKGARRAAEREHALLRSACFFACLDEPAAGRSGCGPLWVQWP